MITNEDLAGRILHETNVDFVQRPVEDILHFVQYDHNMPVIAINLYNNLQKYYLTDDIVSIKFRFRRSDGGTTVKDILGRSDDGHTVYVEVCSYMSAMYGKGFGVIQLFDSDGLIASSSDIILMFNMNPAQSEDIPPRPSYPELEKWVNSVTTETEAGDEFNVTLSDNDEHTGKVFKFEYPDIINHLKVTDVITEGGE